MNGVYAKPKNLSAKMKEVFDDPLLSFYFTKQNVGYSPVYFFKTKSHSYFIGVSEDKNADGEPIYVVSFSGNVGKDKTGNAKKLCHQLFKPHFGEPYDEIDGLFCDYLIYERRNQA